MDTLEILGGAFRIFRDHLALLVMVALFPYLGLLGVEYVVMPLSVGSPGLIYLFLLVAVLVDGSVLAALTVAICRSALGGELTVREVYALTRRENWGAVVLVYLISALLVPVGILFLVLPGLLIGAFFGPAIPVVIMERRRPLEAIGRAIALVQPELLKGMAVFAFFLGVAGFLPMAFLLVQMDLGIGPFTPLLGTIIRSVTLPLGHAATVLFYLSLRAGESVDAAGLADELQRPREG
jgi:hypothetical protein